MHEVMLERGVLGEWGGPAQLSKVWRLADLVEVTLNEKPNHIKMRGWGGGGAVQTRGTAGAQTLSLEQTVSRNQQHGQSSWRTRKFALGGEMRMFFPLFISAGWITVD